MLPQPAALLHFKCVPQTVLSPYAEAGAKLSCESANRWIDNIEALRVGGLKVRTVFGCMQSLHTKF